MSKKLAILVEDDPIHQFLAKKHLTDLDLFDRLEIFNDGKEAYEAIQQKLDDEALLPDLILLDLNMPIWSGWDFLEAFKALDIKKVITIIILTSSDAEADRILADRYGLADHYIIKPLSREKAQIIFDFLQSSND